jgi:LAO/AO transport system kinase
VLDAAAFDRILVETVGVGQSELDVGRSADSTVLVLVPESGDGIQTLKSGIMEIADLFVINKADRPGAEKLRQEIEVTLGIRQGNAFRNVRAHHGFRGKPPAARPVAAVPDAAPAWSQPVLLTTAAKGEGTDAVVAALDAHHASLLASGGLDDRRRRRFLERTREVVERAARRWVWNETGASRHIDERLDDIVAGRISPYEVAVEVLEELKQGERV